MAHETWLDIGLVAFVGGIVANIIIPSRRGPMGFVQASLIGTFAGAMASIVAREFNASEGMQYVAAGIVGLLGDMILTSFMSKFGKQDAQEIHIHGDNTNNQIGNSNTQRGDDGSEHKR